MIYFHTGIQSQEESFQPNHHLLGRIGDRKELLACIGTQLDQVLAMYGYLVNNWVLCSDRVLDKEGYKETCCIMYMCFTQAISLNMYVSCMCLYR